MLALVLAPDAFAQSVLSPNQPVVIELPIENEAPSTATAYGVQLAATIENAQPTGLAVKVRVDTQGSDLGPADIEVGPDKAKTFRIRVVADTDAPDGTFDLKLLPKFQQSPFLVSPDPDALETTVSCGVGGKLYDVPCHVNPERLYGSPGAFVYGRCYKDYKLGNFPGSTGYECLPRQIAYPRQRDTLTSSPIEPRQSATASQRSRAPV